MSSTARITLAALVAAAVAVVGITASVATARTSCTPGVRTVGESTVRTFCGPATATAKIGGKTFHFTGGQCAVEQGYFTVNIGAITLGSEKPKYAYLGIDVKPPKPGTHASQIVSWQTPGKRYSLLPAKVTLAAGLHSGTFSGPVLGGGGSGSGSFHC